MCGYFNSLSILAQASATLLLGDSVPGNVAQPPFSINEFLLPRIDQFQLGQGCFGLGGVLEFVHTDRRESRYDRATGALIRHFLGRTSKHSIRPNRSR